MTVKLSDELKEAIKDLPEKEKNKLLLRLIPKNEILVRQLEFRLLEDSATTVLRREELKEKIAEDLQDYPNRFYSPGLLVLHMRDISGKISRHVNITKDKPGEIELNLLMLNEVLERNEEKLSEYHPYSKVKFDEYVVKRALKLLQLSEKIHEDFRIEFTSEMQKLGCLIGNQPTTMRTAINNMLDVNLLIGFE